MFVTKYRRLLIGACLLTAIIADRGDDVSNNLVTDLAPLLSLFGERVTMQFMSQSMGWADNIILAVVPLGIITTVVSAIRVGGPSWLRAIIGRAVESRAVVEVELMSSTSHEVCELWNGQQIVRIMGKGPIREFIIMVPKGIRKKKKLQSEYAGEVKIVKQEGEPNFRERIFGKLRREATEEDASVMSVSSVIVVRNSEAETEPKDKTRDAAPNLTLNIYNQVGRGDLYAVAAFGVLLQLGILAYYACTTEYGPLHSGLLRNNSIVVEYAFPCTATGTILMSIGMLICSNVVESSTKEKRYLPKLKDMETRVVWLQRSGIANDQAFDSFALFPPAAQEIITTSHRANPIYLMDFLPQKRLGIRETSFGKWLGKWKLNEALTLFGVFFSVSGFLIQFVGLHALHWTASVALLGATVLMTVLRVLVRLKFAQGPEAQTLVPEHELDWLAMTLAGNLERAPWLHANMVKDDNFYRPWASNGDSDGGCDCNFITTGDLRKCKELTFRNSTVISDDQGSSLKDNQINHRIHGNRGLALQSPESNSKGIPHRMMEIRRDLGNLAQWHGPASADAVALARAIEVIMNAMFGTDTLCREAAWSFPARLPFNGTDDEWIDFQMSRDNSGDWRADADEIEALLSLWLYASEENARLETDGENRSEINAQGHTIGIRPLQSRGDSWLRASETAAKRNLRLLGPYTAALYRDLQWWMLNGAIRVFEVDDSESASASALLSVEANRTVGFLTRPIPDHIYMYKRKLPELPSARTSLAVEAFGSLKSIYVQYILSVFMWAVAKSIRKPIEDGANIQLMQRNDTGSDFSWQSISLHSVKLFEMAQAIHATGIASLDDIYLALIPPLSIENKLPWADAIIPWVREHTKHYERRGDWKTTVDAYLWLFEVSKTFPKQISKISALLMEYLRELTSAAELKESQEYYGYADIQDLGEAKLSLESTLRTVEEKILLNLLKLYADQGRPWKCAIVEDFEYSEGGDPDYPNEFHFTILHQHTRQGDISGLRKKIKEKIAEVNSKDIYDWTPLHHAAARGLEPVVEELLQDGADANVLDLLDRTPLHHAAENGHYEVVSILTKQDANKDARDRFNGTALHYATANGQYLTAKFLAETGADVNARDHSGEIPLHIAAANGDLPIVSLLIDVHSDIEARDHFGRTPLHSAAANGHEGAVRALIKEGATIITRDHSDGTAFHSAAKRGHGAILFQMLNYVPKNKWQSMIHESLIYAVTGGYLTAVKLLISDMGADKNTKDSMGRSLLHIAAANGYKAIVSFLIACDVDINSKSDSDRTALSYAVENNHTSVVKLLLENEEVKPESSEMYFGDTPLSLAAERGNDTIIKLLRERADANPSSSNDNKSEEKLQALPIVKPVPAHTGFDSDTAFKNCRRWDGQVRCKPGQSNKHPYIHERNNLADAVYYGDWAKVMRLLSERQQKHHQNWVNCWRILPSTGSGTASGFTPLHQAAWWGNKNAVQELLKLGAWKLARTLRNTSESEKGSRPLEVARDRGHEHLYQLLSCQVVGSTKREILHALQERLHLLIRQKFGDDPQADLECFVLPQVEILTEIQHGIWFTVNPELPPDQQDAGVFVNLDSETLVVMVRNKGIRQKYRIWSNGIQEV